MAFCRRWREKRVQFLSTLAVIFLLSLAFTPRIPPSPNRHRFADMRNLLGVPNTLNVITSFPFLVIGVVGFVLSLHGGDCLGISLKGEVWCWVLFYAGFVGLAFGSSYYHLKPSDARALWDTLPMMTLTVALLSALITERLNERLGVISLFSLLAFILLSIAHERIFYDLRLSIMFQHIPCLAILAIVLLFHSKYTHSRFWFLAAGLYVLARFEAMSDSKVYNASQFTVSGHSLGHFFLAMASFVLTLMLWLRNKKNDRDF